MPGFLPSLFFLVLGIGLIVISIVNRQRAKRAQNWPVVPATILNSEVRKRQQYDSDSTSGRTTYEPVVNYQYSVMGSLYNGSRVSFGDKKTSRKKAEEIVARYPAGTEVNAHYNPDKVEDSVLETAASGSISNLVSGLLLIVLAVAVFFLL
ncbi:MAG TPA: DUF3592 domain-containing protein [Anaerolineaceae bacterium]|nr:DUF3592 domain-containing protein [Anaerolineaceae bacterium]